MEKTYNKVGEFELIDAIMDGKVVYDKTKNITVVDKTYAG